MRGALRCACWGKHGAHCNKIDVIFREYLCLYDNHVYTLPFDGDQFLLFYRRDLQEKDGWEVPKTWDELVAVAGKSCIVCNTALCYC